MKAIFFGSIGSIVETSELQLKAFNEAFKVSGLDWVWELDDYKKMLLEAGGTKRIKAFASANQDALSDDQIAGIHKKKTDLFEGYLLHEKLEPREGVMDLLTRCQDKNIRLAWVTTTPQQNIDSIKAALSTQIDFNIFSFVTSIQDVGLSKPSGEIYHFALRKMAVPASEVLVIEDSESGLNAALEADLNCVAFPGLLKLDQDYSGASACFTSLSDLYLD